MSTETLKYSQAIRKALAEALAADPQVTLLGLGASDPTGIFGTTAGLATEFGDSRVMDIPCAENGMTGIAIGMALGGKKVVLSHQRVDFALLSLEQIINQAAKWHYMFNGQDPVPVVIRMIVGRGWGQGPQHSQFLPTLFTHIPGLRVLAPAFPSDAYHLTRQAIDDLNPTIIFEHRWLHFGEGSIPDTPPINGYKAHTKREGDDITLVSYSYGSLECLEAARILFEHGISAEVIDLRSLAPLDLETISNSVAKTRRLLTFEHIWPRGSIGADIVCHVAETGMKLACPSSRIALPDYSLPTARSLSASYYPDAAEIVGKVSRIFNRNDIPLPQRAEGYEEDKPNPAFKGPF